MTGTEPDDGHNVDQEADLSGDAQIYQASGIADIEHDVFSAEPRHYSDGPRARRVLVSGRVAAVSPYPGMVAFGPEDAEWFFGRDRLLAQLIERLDQRLRDGGPLVVVGASGAGKSSLLRAGLIPRLEQGALAGSQHWPRLSLTPTDRPVTAIAEAIAAVIDEHPADVARQLTHDPESCIDRLRAVLREAGGAGPTMVLVLIIDQLEELFTMCTDQQERHRFLDLISRLTDRGSAGQDPVALVVFGLRADFYAHCADYPQLRSALQDGQVIVGPMSSTELRQAIVLPAQLAGLQVEPGLVEVLLWDLGASAVGGADDAASANYEAGCLPLLAHALRATWLERRGQTLTVEAYRLTGGIPHAVATTAERTFLTLNVAEQRAARALFLRLVKIGDDTGYTRRRVPRWELFGGNTDQRTVLALLDRFTRARLLTQGHDTVEITHNALLRAWPRLRHWIDEDRYDILRRQQLDEAAAMWEREGRDASALHRGSRLAAAREWVSSQRDHGDLNPTTSAFLAASSRHAVRRRVLGWALMLFSVVPLLSVLVLMASGVALSGRWGQMMLLIVVALMVSCGVLLAAVLAMVSRSVGQLLGRCWGAFRHVFGLVAPELVAPPTRDQLERAALHDVASAYRDVMTELNDILELRAEVSSDQAGGAR